MGGGCAKNLLVATSEASATKVLFLTPPPA
jgi:hypothetical protein